MTATNNYFIEETPTKVAIVLIKKTITPNKRLIVCWMIVILQFLIRLH